MFYTFFYITIMSISDFFNVLIFNLALLVFNNRACILWHNFRVIVVCQLHCHCRFTNRFGAKDTDFFAVEGTSNLSNHFPILKGIFTN